MIRLAFTAFVLLVPLVVWLAFPETAGRTLEEIASDDKAARPTGA